MSKQASARLLTNITPRQISALTGWTLGRWVVTVMVQATASCPVSYASTH